MKKKTKRQSRKRGQKNSTVIEKNLTTVDITEDSSGIELSEAYIMRGGQILSSTGHEKSIQNVVSKSMEGSNQADRKDPTEEINTNDIVAPPYNPSVLAKFLDVDVVHFRCVGTKVTDTVGRPMSIVNIGDGEDDSDEFKEAKSEVVDFIENANTTDGFRAVIEKCDMDLESTGYTAFEVIRSLDKKIKNIVHVPARRIRVLRGHRGFVETYYSDYSQDVTETSSYGQDNIYYVPFGEKVLSPTRMKLDGTPERYDPKKDGDISNGVWNLKNKINLNEKLPVDKIQDSANEIFFLKIPHPKSIYYGVPNFIPAISAIKGNLNIRDFFFQYFEHNAVPQYAVIVKGAHLKDEVKTMIQDYFSTHVKGQSHSTLVIPIPASAGGDVEVKFERLSAEVKEGSFQETKKNNQNDIIISHGMSPAIIGMVENASLGSGKGTAQNEVYKNRVVIPRQQRWENALTSLFRLGLGVLDVGVSFEDLDISDKREQRENIIAYVQDGILNRNEARKMAKLGPPIDGGNRYVIIRGGVPIFVDELDADTQKELEEKRAKLLGEKVGALEMDDLLDDEDEQDNSED